MALAKISFVYVTTPSVAVAKRLAELALKKRLATCANILTAMDSIYKWRGKVERQREAVLILKLPRRLFGRLERALRAAHPYETPCIVEIPVGRVSKSYAEWLLKGF